MNRIQAIQIVRQWATLGRWVLIGLAALAAALTAIRFIGGLGTVTNLSDAYPWGLWIGFDILAGIALAAGGFVMAGSVHIFGRHKFHALARPAIFTALLGYLLFIVALMIDLGRPWNMWRVMVHWNHASPMFEVSWCVMLYTFVLGLEFLPAVLEKLRLGALLRLWWALVPWLTVGMLSLFTLAMSGSWGWTLAVAAVLLFWELLMRLGLMPHDKMMPTLLIMAGVIFSTLHQSSLGTLFLIAPHKLHPLWYSPFLPLLLFASAVMVAPAMVILESLVSARAYRRQPELDLLRGAAAAMPYPLGIYLALKLGDLVAKGAVESLLAPTAQAAALWAEIALLALPLVLFLTDEVIASQAGLLWSAVLVIAGLVLNRINIAVTGISAAAWETYYPSWMEIAISLGVVAGGLLAYDLLVRFLPIYEAKHEALA
jgi:formate dehydrogenase iron-sulfur subunit